MKLLILIFLKIFANSVLYHKIVLDDPTAKCLDGSQGVYYLSKGDPQKVLVHLQGGAWCGDIDPTKTLYKCYERSKTVLGSSKDYPDTMEFNEGILSDQPANIFKGWTRAHFRYCDGSGHQGTRTLPVRFKDAQLYFRGQNITIAQLQSLNSNASIFSDSITHFVWSGSSAGGLAAFQWTDYVRNRLDNSTKFWSIIDSAVFLDWRCQINGKRQFRSQYENLLNLANQQTRTPIEQCDQFYKNERWKCMFAQYFYKFVKAPIFLIQPLYDQWSMINILQMDCVDRSSKSISVCSKRQMQVISSYHSKMLQIVSELINKKGNGGWATACIFHSFLLKKQYNSPVYEVPFSSSMTLANSLSEWMQDDRYSHIDSSEWKLGFPCSGRNIK